MVIKNKRLTHFALPIRDLLHLNEFQVKINYPYLAWKRDSNFQFSSLTTELFTNIINQKKKKHMWLWISYIWMTLGSAHRHLTMKRKA